MSASPVGFAANYARVRKDPATARQLRSLLGLVGYDAPEEDIVRWPMERRVEAEVYAVNVHLRAQENVLRRCPRPEWFPEPWQGSSEGEGVFASPGGSRLACPELAEREVPAC